MDLWTENAYKQRGREKGISSATLDASIAQARSLQSRGVPAVLTLNHLAYITGVEYRALREVVERKCDPYRGFYIAKRSGGKRLISVPSLPVFRVQHWLAHRVLSKVAPHDASFAYYPGRSCYDCAEQHTKCRWLVKIDIKRFFESISELRAYRVLRDIGFAPLVSFEMARLCTRAFLKQHKWYSGEQWKYRLTGSSRGPTAYLSHTLGHLPQGAPTSPQLANLSVVSMDRALAHLARREDCVYTRYADDMYFSTRDASFTRSHASRLIGRAYRLLGQEGFAPNTSKTTVAPPGARKIVLGLVVNSEKPTLPRRTKDRIRAHLHYCLKYSPESHSKRRGFRSVLSFRRHLEGLLAYASHVDSQFHQQCLAELNQIKWPV